MAFIASNQSTPWENLKAAVEQSFEDNKVSLYSARVQAALKVIGSSPVPVIKPLDALSSRLQSRVAAGSPR